VESDIIETGTATETATVESDIIETGTATTNGNGNEMTMDSPGYVSGDHRVEAKIPRVPVMTEIGGRNGGAMIVDGKIAGAGIASKSVTGMAIGSTNSSVRVGQAGVVEAHEVLNTVEAMHDDILVGCAYYCSGCLTRARYTLCVLIFHRLSTVQICPADCPRYGKIIQ